MSSSSIFHNMMSQNNNDSLRSLDSIDSVGSNITSAAAEAPMTPIPSRRYGRRVKMASDISGMFVDGAFDFPSSPPMMPSLLTGNNSSSTAISMRGAPAMPMAASGNGNSSCLALTPARRLRTVKRRMLLDSVLSSTVSQMAALQLQQSSYDDNENN